MVIFPAIILEGKIVKRMLSLPLMAMILSSCQTPAVVKDVHMGADIVYGADVIAYFGLVEALHARPLYSTKSGFGLKTSFQSPRKMGFLESWSYGKQFDYVKGTTEKTLCLIPPCMPMSAEQGIVSMGDADFVAAASKGFEFELVGKAGKVVGRVPAQTFRTVLDMKSKLKPALAPPIAAAPNASDDTSEKPDEDS